MCDVQAAGHEERVGRRRGGVRGGLLQHHGRAVQVVPIKPTLTAPGTKRLKLECDEPLSNFAFNFKLRRYTTGFDRWKKIYGETDDVNKTGAYTRPHLSSSRAVFGA
jgi:hypothetical protein